MNANQPTTPESQAAQAGAKSRYVVGTTARVINRLNGSHSKLDKIKISGSDIRTEAIRVDASISQQREKLKFHIPPLTAEINRAIDHIQQELGNLATARSKLLPLLTEQSNQLINENSELQNKVSAFDDEMHALANNVDALYEQASKGDITPQKLHEKLKEIIDKIPRERVAKLEDDHENMLTRLKNFGTNVASESNAVKAAQVLQPGSARNA